MERNIFVATALHAIAVGNMLPAFHLCAGAPAPLMTICVDQTEFVVNKLRDRGTHQAYGVVTNAQDFMHVLRFYLERWEQAVALPEAVVERQARADLVANLRGRVGREEVPGVLLVLRDGSSA